MKPTAINTQLEDMTDRMDAVSLFLDRAVDVLVTGNDGRILALQLIRHAQRWADARISLEGVETLSQLFDEILKLPNLPEETANRIRRFHDSRELTRRTYFHRTQSIAARRERKTNPLP
jgi:hypothetical protein